MNRHINHISAIAGRLSLRPPQRRSLEILDRITEVVPPRKDIDLDAAIKAIQVVYMVETKARSEMGSPEVLAKKESAIRWCVQASEHARTCEGKPWQYLLIPHDSIAENMTLAGLAARFKV